jgi:hypothetical protein
MTGGFLLGSGSMTCPYGDAPVLFCPSTTADEAEEACPDLGWARDAVKQRDDGRF